MQMKEFSDNVTLDQFGLFMKDILMEDASDDQIKELFDYLDKDSDGILCVSECQYFNKIIKNRIVNVKSALIVVDFQNDFVNGSLSIKKGTARQDPMDALTSLNHLISKVPFDRIIYTQDWHPSNHISFYEHCRNNDRQLRKEDKVRKLKPFDAVQFDKPSKFSQVLYPVHCVQNSWGSQISPHIQLAKDAKFVRKGTNIYIDSYSAFADNIQNSKSELERFLLSEDITVVFVCGLAYEICVAATAKDSAKLGFLTALVCDCSKGLSLDGITNVNDQLSKLNAAIVESTFVEKFVNKEFNKLPWQWIQSIINQAKYIEENNGTDENSIETAEV
uniref:EF-hand domain-containing protein n=1 Tax=Rhabditophanes sp. KR3021 TaxID=114890 RepID=A0AC35U7R0_9BILA